MPPSEIQLPTTEASVNIRLLNGGSMTAEYHKLHAGELATEFRMYNWCFLIHHEQQGRWVLWDLGMSSNPDDYPPVIANGPIKEAKVQDPHESIASQIERRSGVSADGQPPFFGPGTAEYCTPGHLTNPSPPWDGRYFDPERATERWETLQGPWIQFGPFEHAMNFFGDGSFWIIQAPGHMPGNLCACARLPSGEWVMLASDCCHSRALLNGEKEFGMFKLPDENMFCLHMDIPAALDTLARIRVMEKELGVHIALAHDSTWMESERDSVLLSLLDDRILENIRIALPQQQPF
ncbi:hypothetical protein BDV12DRAFT_211274 [Aspergillus spectabilis]